MVGRLLMHKIHFECVSRASRSGPGFRSEPGRQPSWVAMCQKLRGRWEEREGMALSVGPQKLQPKTLPGPKEGSLCRGHTSPHGGGGLHLRRPTQPWLSHCRAAFGKSSEVGDVRLCQSGARAKDPPVLTVQFIPKTSGVEGHCPPMLRGNARSLQVRRV